MSFRTGVSIPFGSASGARGDDLGARYAWQIPFGIDLGAKVTDAVFVGAYLGVGFGAEGSDRVAETYCDDDDSNLENDVSCSAVTSHLGVEARYSFAPAEEWNPWLGFGIGYELAHLSIDDRARGYRESTRASGWTLAKVSVGADHRSAFALGPFGEIAVGRFDTTRTEIDDEVTYEGDIDDPAFHAWITIGIRGVIGS